MKKLYCLYCLFTIALVCTACPVKGQAVQKKNLTPSDYDLWSSVTIDKVSATGGWVSYMVQYPNQNDTLYVRSNKATKTYAFPKGFDGKFIEDDFFACRMQDASLHVLDLKQGKVSRYPDISQYGVSENGEYIISIAGNSLLIRELKGDQRLLVEGVRSFSLSPRGNALCYSGPEGINYLELKSKTLKEKRIYKGKASVFAWQQNGESLAFISTYQTEEAAVLWYHIGKNRLLHQDTLHSKSLGAIAPRPFKFSISDDGERVFYALKGDDAPGVTPNVEIWNSSDPMTYGESALKGSPASYQKTAVWWPERKIAFRLTDSLRTSVFLSGRQQYAITYNPRGTKPYFDYYPLTDYYITDLATQKTKLLLKDHTLSQSDITASPSGRYIAYQKSGSWWLYHTDSGRHISLSGISPGFDTALAENSLWDAPTIAGWSEQDTKMYFFDTFDLWVIDTETLTFKRLTHGREKGIKFRPADSSIGMQRMNLDGFTLPEIDQSAAIKLLGTDTASKKTAFYRIGTKARKLLEADKSITQITPATNEAFYYVAQAYDTPPAIRHVDSRGKNTVVYQSNPQHKNFYWGNVTLISYRNGENKELQGLLYYPANYDPLKKYPMVVYVYETLSNGLHSYINPAGTNYTGFNITNLLSRGYLVLCPDIAYRIGDVGKSAADCIVSATQSIIATGVADEDRIALFGHSFGGYEAAFTATQTGMFKTIIAGAAITDLTSAYLGISDNSKLPNIWRFEHQQWRMGKSFFEIPDNYRRNSTVVHAEKIATPLLLFSGKKDGQVDFRQSRELYLALRRLGRPAIMLLYPEEGHVLTREQNQMDFTTRLEAWLAYFLQDSTVPAWMKGEFDK